MTATLVTLLFVLVIALVAPALVVLLIWRVVRSAMKNVQLPGGATLDAGTLRELIRQARAQQLSPDSAPALVASAAGPEPATVVKAMGHGTSIIAFLFTGIGAIAAAVAILFGVMQLEFLADVEHAEGRVVRNVSKGHKSGYYPVVRFHPPDADEPIEFQAPIGNRPAQFDIGEGVPVVYPPGRPHEAKIDNWIQLWFAPMLGGFFTLVFGGIGAGFLVPVLRQRLRARWARENGTQTFARFCGVERDATTRVNGRNPLRVFAEWRNPVDGKLYRFQSPQALWRDPSGWLSQNPNIPLRVDPSDPRRYWFDVKSLPLP